MFRVRGAKENENAASMLFGTTAPQENLPPVPLNFTYVDDPRTIFLRFRVKKVVTSQLAVTPSVNCEAEDVSDGNGVMLKTFFIFDNEEEPVTERLIYETQAYRFVRQELAPYMSTVVAWFATYMYKPQRFDISQWDPENLNKYRSSLRESGHYDGFADFYKIVAQKTGINTIFTQVTKRIPEDYMFLILLSMELENVKFLRELLFQIVFTLACMGELYIQHNDLHVNNILVGYNLPVKRKGYYFKGMLFWVEQYMQIRIFDWDSAYIEKIGPNSGLQHFQEIGIGNHYNPRYDLYTILCSMEEVYRVYNTAMPDEIQRFVSTVRPRLYQKSQNRLCNVDPVTKQCIPFPPNEPNDILTPEQALQLPFFEIYRDRNPTVLQAGPGFIEFKEPPSKGFFNRLFKK